MNTNRKSGARQLEKCQVDCENSKEFKALAENQTRTTRERPAKQHRHVGTVTAHLTHKTLEGLSFLSFFLSFSPSFFLSSFLPFFLSFFHSFFPLSIFLNLSQICRVKKDPDMCYTVNRCFTLLDSSF